MNSASGSMEGMMFEKLKGLTIASIAGASYGSRRIKIKTTCGAIMLLYHDQDCCEVVEVEDVNGDITDVIGTPVLEAEERVSDDATLPSRDESDTWTFYTIRTIKGSLDIRWHGSSNGHYSESVDCVFATYADMKIWRIIDAP